MRSRYVLAGGVKTHYWEAGEDGPPVVALHGGVAGTSGGAGMGLFLPLLADRFRVIAIDSVGGFEEFTPAFKLLTGYDFSREGMVKLMEALVYDRSRDQAAYVAGVLREFF